MLCDATLTEGGGGWCGPRLHSSRPSQARRLMAISVHSFFMAISELSVGQLTNDPRPQSSPPSAQQVHSKVSLRRAEDAV
jgi:hypothetical protein